MNNLRERIKSNETVKTVNTEKQIRHIRNNEGYIEGRSYLLDGTDAQELVDKYHGTGELELSWNGSWTNKEFVIADKIIGININLETNKETPTNRFIIHYSKTGTHIVPTSRE